MELQQAISREKHQSLIGTTRRVLVDGREDGVYVGRTEWDAPEIDATVLLSSNEAIEVGEFLDVAIESASEYDMYGSLISVRGQSMPTTR